MPVRLLSFTSLLTLGLCFLVSTSAYAASEATGMTSKPLPRGFDSIDERGRAPLGFTQNPRDNTLAQLEAVAEDGDFAVLRATVKEQIDSSTFMLCDDSKTCLKATLSENTEPSGVQLEVGKSYQLWVQVERSFLTLNLAIRICAPLQP